MWPLVLLLALLAPADPLLEAMALTSKGDFLAAQAKLEAILEAKPQDARAGYWLGLVHEGRGDLPAARAALTKARADGIETGDTDGASTAAQGLARVLITLSGRPKLELGEREKLYEEVVEILDVYFDGEHFLRGRMLARLGKFQDADASFRRCIATNRDGPCFAGLAQLYIDHGHVALGVKVLEQGAKHAQSGNGDMRIQLGRAHLLLGKYEDAATALQQADGDSNYRVALYRGFVQAHLHDRRKATEQFAAMVKLENPHPEDPAYVDLPPAHVRAFGRWVQKDLAEAIVSDSGLEWD